MSNQFAERKSIKAVILAGSRDFGRYPLASRLPPALWPLVGKPVLEHMLRHLSLEGINHVVVCTNGDSSMLWQSVGTNDYVKLEFLEEPLPVGTGGCIRDAAGDQTDALLLVFPVAMVCPPKVDALIRAHNDGQCDLTVVFNPGRTNGKFVSEAAGIYICETGVLEHIPKEGYFDIKEGLIPEMLRVGKTVHTAVLPNHVGNFREPQGYLDAVARYLMSAPKLCEDLKLREQTNSQGVWVAPNARVDASARIYGPVVIMDCARISKGVAIFGPTILGRNVTIGKDSILVNSVLWDDARVGKDCQVQRCVVDYHAVVRDGSVREEEAILFEPEGVLKGSVDTLLEGAKYNTSRLQSALQTQLHKINGKLAGRLKFNRGTTIPWLAGSLILIAFVWCYWPGIVDLWSVWRRSDEYSSGLLVPFLAVYVLWSRRLRLAQVNIKPCVWGLFAFLGAQALRLFGLFFMYSSAERLSVVLSIAALVLFLFGRQFFRGIVALLLFLCLMLPWPIRVQAAVTLPAQRWATSSAVFCLEMAGYEVTQEGNVIHIGQATVAVAEACNGLRMITAFFVISGLVVLLIKRAWWEKLIILASSLPIGLLCNTVRLTITALAFTVLNGEQWERIFHDFGGYAMMPLALAAIVAELWLLARLTTLPTKKQAIIITRQK
jgi:exosortase